VALGGVEVFAGAAMVFAGANLPSAGLVVAGLAIAAAGLGTMIGARWMPAVTRTGAMVRAMLSAYRRTLQKAMEQARSLSEVVASRALPWLEAPDQALVWGVALGLHREVEQVLARSVEDLRHETAGSNAWLPLWYLSSGGGTWQPGTSGSGGPGGLAPGLMSGSAIPNFGAMVAAIGTIGATSSGGGGGFGGGSGFGGGGGGGGASGGF
jgi:hypothetical protein